MDYNRVFLHNLFFDLFNFAQGLSITANPDSVFKWQKRDNTQKYDFFLVHYSCLFLHIFIYYLLQ